MNFTWLSVSVGALFSLAIACGGSSGDDDDDTGTTSSSSGGSSGSTSSSGGSSSTEFTCTVASNTLGDQSYECPTEAAAAKCDSNVTSCTPTNHKRGTVAPGGECAFDETYGFNTTCAPAAKWASSELPTGVDCAGPSNGPTVCVHGCATRIS